jgi:hypothetical protein
LTIVFSGPVQAPVAGAAATLFVRSNDNKRREHLPPVGILGSTLTNVLNVTATSDPGSPLVTYTGTWLLSAGFAKVVPFTIVPTLV